MVHKQSAIIGALLGISSDTAAAMTCNAAADAIVSEAPEWATSHLEAAMLRTEMRCVDARCISESVFSQL